MHIYVIYKCMVLLSLKNIQIQIKFFFLNTRIFPFYTFFMMKNNKILHDSY